MAQFYDYRLIIEDTLPAAGAELKLAPIAINTFADFTPLLGYVPNGAGGAINVRIEISHDNSPDSYYAIGESQSPAIVAGNDVIINTQRSAITYTGVGGGGPEFVTLPTYTVVGSWLRITVAETGAVGTPGDFRIALYLRGNQ